MGRVPGCRQWKGQNSSSRAEQSLLLFEKEKGGPRGRDRISDLPKGRLQGEQSEQSWVTWGLQSSENTNDFTVWLSWYSEGCLCLLRSQPLFFLLFQPLCLLSHQFIAQTNTTMSKPGKWTVLVKLEAHVPEYLEQHWWGRLSSTPEASEKLSACFFPIRLHL